MPVASCRPPGDSRDVITSSKISTTSCSVVAVAQRLQEPCSPGMQPALPCSGSTMTAARRWAFSAIRRAAPSASLYWPMTVGNGALMGDPAAVA